MIVPSRVLFANKHIQQKKFVHASSVRFKQRFMRLALEQYIASYEADDFVHTHMSEVRLLYLTGELYRRLGKEKQAIIYFSRVIARKKETIEKGIVNMAYDRWQEIREEKKGAQ